MPHPPRTAVLDPTVLVSAAIAIVYDVLGVGRISYLIAP